MSKRFLSARQSFTNPPGPAKSWNETIYEGVDDPGGSVRYGNATDAEDSVGSQMFLADDEPKEPDPLEGYKFFDPQVVDIRYS